MVESYPCAIVSQFIGILNMMMLMTKSFLSGTLHLKPLNTCYKHFKTIFPNLPLDGCEIQIMYTVVVLTAMAPNDCLQSENDCEYRFILPMYE